MIAIERIQQFRALWNVVIKPIGASLECPHDAQIFRWISRFSDEVVSYALSRLQVKISKGEIVASENAGRFLTAVMAAEDRARRIQNKREVAHA